MLKLRYEQRKRVTRKLAGKLLQDLNFGNRKINEAHVFIIGKDMASGCFRLNPQPIVIHEDSKKAAIRILDGQHRLTSAERNAPADGVEMVFCYAQGNEAEIAALQATIDSGKSRSTTDRGGFQKSGITQGFLEKAAMLYQVIGQPVDDKNPDAGVYGWMRSPKASYSACKAFGEDNAVVLLEAERLAGKHKKTGFKRHKPTKMYLSLTYLVGLLNGVKVDDLDAFAAEAANDKSVLSCKLSEVYRDGHAFAERLKDGSKNASGIQFLLIRDLLQAFVINELTKDFQPVLDVHQIDGTTLTEFFVD